MKQKALRTANTAVITALLLCLQWAGSLLPDPLAGQLVTGTCINCILALAAHLDIGTGIAVAMTAPVFACLLRIGQDAITVAPVIVGNLSYIALLTCICAGNTCPVWRWGAAVISAAGVKFLVLYLLVIKVICGIGSQALIAPSTLKTLPSMFAWPQFISGIVGGAVACLLCPVIEKTLHR